MNLFILLLHIVINTHSHTDRHRLGTMTHSVINGAVVAIPVVQCVSVCNHSFVRTPHFHNWISLNFIKATSTTESTEREGARENEWEEEKKCDDVVATVCIYSVWCVRVHNSFLHVIWPMDVCFVLQNCVLIFIPNDVISSSTDIFVFFLFLFRCSVGWPRRSPGSSRN